MSNDQKLSRNVGLPGAIATLVGFVVGASVFLLPGELAGMAGPGVIISYVLASFAASLSCFVAAQIGSSFSTSGANYVAVCQLLSPFYGFIMMWLYLAALCLAVALVAYGFADFLQVFFPNLNSKLTAIALVMSLTGLNLVSTKIAVSGQELMVLIFIAALLVFCFGGLPLVQANLLSPFLPKGWPPVLVAATSAVFSFVGFMVIADISEEIKHPERTIPLALLVSFLLVLFLYLAVALVLVGNVPWSELKVMKAPVSTVSAKLLPSWLAQGIAVSALLAAATTINGVILTASRNVLALARDQVFPKTLSRLTDNGVPYIAVLVIACGCLVCILFSATILQYALFTVVGFMFYQSLAAIAGYRLPGHLPSRYASSSFRLKPVVLRGVSVATVITSLIFLGIAVSEEKNILLVLPIYVGFGVIYYFVKIRNTEKTINIKHSEEVS